MAKVGVNVPPGLTITTEVCQEFYRVGECLVGSSKCLPASLACYARQHLPQYAAGCAEAFTALGLSLQCQPCCSVPGQAASIPLGSEATIKRVHKHITLLLHNPPDWSLPLSCLPPPPSPSPQVATCPPA
jgi:hypothetical protein